MRHRFGAALLALFAYMAVSVQAAQPFDPKSPIPSPTEKDWLAISKLPDWSGIWVPMTKDQEVLFTPGRVTMLGESDGNRLRRIYTDGRPHPKDVEETFHGHSTGHWEGNTLVIDTVGMTDDHHWIEDGVPAGPKLHVVERIRLVDGGKALEDQFTMTDPDNWEGDWVSTKRFNRQDRTDIEEHVCIYEQVNKLPSFKFNIRE